MSDASVHGRVVSFEWLLLSLPAILASIVFVSYSPAQSVTATSDPFFQRYNFYDHGIHGYTAYGYQTHGDTFQCTWDHDNSTYCQANDTKDNTTNDTGPGANLLLEKFDSTLVIRTLVNDFQTSGSIQGYGQQNTACNPTTWCSGSYNYTDGTWKSCGLAEIGSVLYMCITLNQNQFPYGSYTATEVESYDNGGHWCNPSHTDLVNKANGCTGTIPNTTKGDVPNPSDTPLGNIHAMRGLHFISYGQNNGQNGTGTDTTAHNDQYAYAVASFSGILYCVRVPIANLPALQEDDVEFYTNSGGTVTWPTSSTGGVPAGATPINTPGRMDNTIYLPGPHVYLSMVNNLINYGTSYEGDSRIIEATEPWGPWYTVGEEYSQTTWNFGSQPLGAMLAGGGPWTLQDIESGFFYLTTSQADSNGYSSGFRGLTVTSGATTWPESQLDKDMKNVGGLYWLYDGEWHINNPDNWYTISDNSGNSNSLDNQQYQYNSLTGTYRWVNEPATYSKYGFAGFNGNNAQAVGMAPPQNTSLTYFLVFRHCCTSPNNYEELMAGNKSSDYTKGVDFQRVGTNRDQWQVLDYNTGSSALTLTDGSYQLVVIEQTPTMTSLYTSDSLSDTPSNGGTVTPKLTFYPTPDTTMNPVYFGNLNGNTSSTANFFSGTLVMAAVYSGDIEKPNIANLIYNIRMDLANDAINGYASSSNVKRRVYLPMSFYGAWPLDYQPQPYASYSTRRLSTNYTGAILQANGTDVFADSSGLINGSLRSACGTSTCKVTKWYDQSGNGFDLTQTATANQPIIMSGGNFSATDPLGNPTIPFGGSQWMETGTESFSLVSSAVSVHSVGSASTLNANGDVLAYLGNPYTKGSGVSTADMATGELFGITSAGALNAYRDGIGGASLAPLHAGGFFSGTSVYDSYNHRMYADAQTPVVVNNASTSGGSGRPAEFFGYNLAVGWDTDSGTDLHWRGNISELLLYNYALTDTSAAQLTKEDKIFFNTNH
jgi:hypothetical protein